jgi:prephenate dehydrogenase
VGLIGGSIARALRRLPAVGRPTIVAYTPAEGEARHGARAALDAGVVDRVADDPLAAIDGADLIVLAMPAGRVEAALSEIAAADGPAREPARAATVTDVASSKAAIVARADELGLRFVGGHPMAGRETTGFSGSIDDLFVDRPWVVVPGRGATAVDIARVEWLARACGARPIRMTASDHDAAVAAISHLPLVLSAALVDAVAGAVEGTPRDDWPSAASLAATGWASMTRLATGDPTMGAGILATNASAVAARLADLRDALDAWAAEFERPGGPDEERLRLRLEAARRRLADRPPPPDATR